MEFFIGEDGKCYRWVYTPYVVKEGRKIFPKNAKVFKFPMEVGCPSGSFLSGSLG